MSRTSTFTLGAIALATAAAAACSDSSTAPSSTSGVSANLLATAFASSTPGYNYANSSFSASSGSNSTGSSTTGSFGPGGPDGHGGHGDGGPGFGDFMGGLGGDFAGFGGFGPGFGRGPFGDQSNGGLTTTCTFSSSTGVITCQPVTINGLTVTRTAQYLNTAGTAEQTFDTATNTAITNVTVTGTTTFTPHDHHGFGPGFGPDSSNVTVASATNTVNTQSYRKVVGLAASSTQRTVNSTSSGTETTAGKLSDSSSFTATRVMGDTVTNVVTPVPSSTSTPGSVYPTAGTIVRASTASVTTTSGTKTVSRREVITYNGSSTATVVITQNDTTKNCTLPLPRGRLSCS